jgi:hypothetical protein
LETLALECPTWKQKPISTKTRVLTYNKITINNMGTSNENKIQKIKGHMMHENKLGNKRMKEFLHPVSIFSCFELTFNR